MPRIATKFLSALLCVSLTACTSMRAVPDWRDTATSRANSTGLHVGDELTLTTTSAGPLFIQVAAIEPGFLVGRTSDKPAQSESTRVPLDQITGVERKELDVLKTTLLVALIVLVGLTAAVKNAAFYPPPP